MINCFDLRFESQMKQLFIDLHLSSKIKIKVINEDEYVANTIDWIHTPIFKLKFFFTQID
jgi:hypothetical protein